MGLDHVEEAKPEIELDVSSRHSSGITLEVSSPSSLRKTRDEISSPSTSSSSSSRSSHENIPVKGPLENSTNGPTSPSQPKPVSPPAQSPSPPMKSPPVQAMGYPPGYDPNRIPASIFATKASNPGEWSVNSNESLFSIQMEKNSFSNDYGIIYGKSGELPRLDDWITTQPPPTNNPRSSSVPEPKTYELPPVLEVPTHEEHSGELPRTPRKDDKKTNHADHDHVMKNQVPFEAVHSPPEVKKAQKIESSVNQSPSTKHATMPSPPRFSEESGNSGSSFAFPVLNDGMKTSSMTPRSEAQSAEAEAAKESSSRTTTRFMDTTTRWFSSCSFFSCWPRTWCASQVKKDDN